MPGDGRTETLKPYCRRVPDQNSPPLTVTLPETGRREAVRVVSFHETVLYRPAGIATPRMLNASSGSSRSKSCVTSKSTRSPLSKRKPKSLRTVLRVSRSQSMSMRCSYVRRNSTCRNPRRPPGRGANVRVGWSRRNPFRWVNPRAGPYCSSSSRYEVLKRQMSLGKLSRTPRAVRSQNEELPVTGLEFQRRKAWNWRFLLPRKREVYRSRSAPRVCRSRGANPGSSVPAPLRVYRRPTDDCRKSARFTRATVKSSP